MLTKRLEIGAMVTLFIAIVSGAAFIGRLHGSVSALQREVSNLSSGTEITAMKEKAIGELNSVATELQRQLPNVDIVSMPIGSIIDYVGPIESDDVQSDIDLSDLLAKGHKVWAKGHPNWVVCNGATLSDDEYDDQLRQLDKNDIRGFQLPDLRDRFTKGATLDGVGEMGGKMNEELSVGHIHGISPCGGADGTNALLVKSWQIHAANCNERASSRTQGSSLSSLTINHEPPYFGVLKIMRIR